MIWVEILAVWALVSIVAAPIVGRRLRDQQSPDTPDER